MARIRSNIRLGVLLTLILTLWAPDSRAETPDSAAIRQIFTEYRQSIVDRDGQKAASLVTGATLKYAEKVRDRALSMPERKLRFLPLMDISAALLARFQADPSALKRMSGHDLLASVVTHGGFDPQFIDSLRIGELTVFTRWAFAPVLGPDGRPIRFKFLFRREKGRWLVDLEPILRQLRVLTPLIARTMGKSDEEFVYFVLESSTGRKPTAAVWTPPTVN